MKTHCKKLKVGQLTSSIALEHDNSVRDNDIELELKAIYILLGGYNEFGKKIDTEKYKEIRANFNDCINEIKSLL